MKTSSVTSAAAVLVISFISSTAAQDEELCNYAPSTFNFEMDLSKNCNDETLSNNVGIDGSICFYTYGADDDASANDVITESNPFGGAFSASGIAVEEDMIVLSSSEKMTHLMAKVDISSHIEHAKKDTQVHQHHRIMQTKDPVPTKITSVTFVEFDNKIAHIINQNSTYFDTELFDGDKISYPSIASKIDNSIPLCEQTGLLPGGIMLIVFGVNKDNVIVRNTIAWAYKLNECTPVESQGDTIGLVKINNYTPPAVLPPAVEDTPSPMTPAPVPYPTMPLVSTSKAGKGTKGSKAEKMSMPSYAKSKKGDTKSSKVMAAVSHLADVGDEMEMTLNESSSVIEALVTLTSNTAATLAEGEDEEDV